MELANNYDRINKQIHYIYEQKKEIDNYKPHLLVIKSLESQYRAKKMIPCCPVCNEPFYLEEIVAWIGWLYGEARIKKRRDKKD